MSVSSIEGRRLKAFRLSEVDIVLRRRAMEAILRTPGSADGMLVAAPNKLGDRLAIGFAVENPSDRVYWVSQAAWDRVMKRRAR